ncbi:MAG TPA: HAMP domain-containing sensor histidine kinase [Actinomycetota bacterium]
MSQVLAEQAPEPVESQRATIFKASVAFPVIVWLVLELVRDPGQLRDPAILFWIAAVIVVDLIPVPGWADLQLSLSFPILLGVAIVYSPAVAAFIALIGSFDPRELHHQVSFVRALFNRCQMAISIYAGSALFHAFAHASSPWYILLPAVVLAAIASYAVNTTLVAMATSLDRGVSVGTVLKKMHGSAPYEFLFSYLGLGLFGAVIARFYSLEGVWSVAVFLAPLVFARQMYFRSRSLADRLAEQNALLAAQAERLESLLEKEHETVAELREFSRMKGEFVAVVSHELRTPVTALIGYAKTLHQPEFSGDAKLRDEFLDRMVRQGDRLLRLVENLLTAANLESQQLKLSLGRVLFEDICRETVEGLAAEHGRVKLTLPEELPVLLTDRQLLGRVVSNLLDNALKYSPEGTSCELGAERDGVNLRFWVRDHGIGIDPAKVEKIFDRFYQVDSSHTRSFRGAGLGLSLVHDLLEHLGGEIEVSSAPGEGSTFTVTLPARHPHAGPAIEFDPEISELASGS